MMRRSPAAEPRGTVLLVAATSGSGSAASSSSALQVDRDTAKAGIFTDTANLA
jgi:hypothetical protein